MKKKASKEKKVLTLNDLAILVKANSSSIDDLAQLTKANSSSIDDLAAMVARRFDSVDGDIESVRNEVKAVEHRLERKIESLDYKIAHHSTSWDRALDKNYETIQEHERRINVLEDQMVR